MDSGRPCKRAKPHGNVSFVKRLPCSALAPTFKLSLPYAAMEHLQDLVDSDFELAVSATASACWAASILRRRNRDRTEYILKGWRLFIEANSARVGDHFSFELVAPTRLVVQPATPRPSAGVQSTWARPASRPGPAAMVPALAAGAPADDDGIFEALMSCLPEPDLGASDLAGAGPLGSLCPAASCGTHRDWSEQPSGSCSSQVVPGRGPSEACQWPTSLLDVPPGASGACDLGAVFGTSPSPEPALLNGAPLVGFPQLPGPLSGSMFDGVDPLLDSNPPGPPRNVDCLLGAMQHAELRAEAAEQREAVLSLVLEGLQGELRAMMPASVQLQGAVQALAATDPQLCSMLHQHCAVIQAVLGRCLGATE